MWTLIILRLLVENLNNFFATNEINYQVMSYNSIAVILIRRNVANVDVTTIITNLQLTM